MVGRNVISVVVCIACDAFNILHVSLSVGMHVGFNVKSFSTCENKLHKCGSLVFIVETSSNVTVNIGLCASIHVTSGPAF